MATGFTINDVGGNPTIGTPITISVTYTPLGSYSTVSYAIQSPIPDGYSIDSSTGVLTSNPSIAQPGILTIQATSGNLPTQTKNLTFVRPIPTGFTINDVTGTPTIGTPITLSVTISPPGAVGGIVTWVIIEPTPVPAGYSIGRNTGVLTSNSTAKPTTLTIQANVAGVERAKFKVLTFVRP